MKNSIPLNGFIQICVVVEDFETAVDSWCEVLNAPRPKVRDNKAAPIPGETYRGEQAVYGLKMAVFDCKERGYVIELISPDDNPSTFREYLDKHGNGVHHVGFQVGDARDAVIAELQSMGYDTARTVGYYTGGSWTVVDAEDKLGVNLNIKPHP